MARVSRSLFEGKRVRTEKTQTTNVGGKIEQTHCNSSLRRCPNCSCLGPFAGKRSSYNPAVGRIKRKHNNPGQRTHQRRYARMCTTLERFLVLFNVAPDKCLFTWWCMYIFIFAPRQHGVDAVLMSIEYPSIKHQ